MARPASDKFCVASGTVQPYVCRETPFAMHHFGRCEYDRNKPVLSDSLRQQGQAVCDALNAGEIDWETAKKRLDKIWY